MYKLKKFCEFYVKMFIKKRKDSRRTRKIHETFF